MSRVAGVVVSAAALGGWAETTASGVARAAYPALPGQRSEKVLSVRSEIPTRAVIFVPSGRALAPSAPRLAIPPPSVVQVAPTGRTRTRGVPSGDSAGGPWRTRHPPAIAKVPSTVAVAPASPDPPGACRNTCGSSAMRSAHTGTTAGCGPAGGVGEFHKDAPPKAAATVTTVAAQTIAIWRRTRRRRPMLRTSAPSTSGSARRRSANSRKRVSISLIEDSPRIRRRGRREHGAAGT